MPASAVSEPIVPGPGADDVVRARARVSELAAIVKFGGSGRVVSIVHVSDAGVGSGLAPSSARTSNVCCPSAIEAKSLGELHGANAPPSSRHSNVAPGSEL